MNQEIPTWAIERPKRMLQVLWDFISIPLRFAVLPDAVCEALHMTSLRAERFAAVLPKIRGNHIDIGAGLNELSKLYLTSCSKENTKVMSVGVDVVDWGSGCKLVKNSHDLPFSDGSFDTVTLIACLNHIPMRGKTLSETHRILSNEGRVIITMIGPIIGEVGHKIWWYSEDKHRVVEDGEVMGMSLKNIKALLEEAGFVLESISSFVYGLNKLIVAKKKPD